MTLNAPFRAVLALLAGLALAGAVHAQSGTKPGAAKPAPGGQGLRVKPAAETPAKAPAEAAGKPGEIDPKRIEAIFECLAAGLPQDWKRAWVRIDELSNTGGEREFDAKYLFTREGGPAAGEPLRTCDAAQVARGVYELNEYLPGFEERQWKSVTVEFSREGKFEIKYDYGK